MMGTDMAGHQRNAPVDDIARRREQVAELLLHGLTQRAIAARLQVSKGTVSNDVNALRHEWADRRTATYEEHVGRQMARLDQLERLLSRSLVDDSVDRLQAIDRALKILDRRARLLGLDAPEALTVGFDLDEARRKVREYLDAGGPPDDHESP